MPFESLNILLAAAASLVSFAGMWRGLDREPWLDELATLDLVDRDGGLARLLRDIHPPLFLLVAAEWARTRRDWRRLRLPGALATALSVGATALSVAPAGRVAVASAGVLAALSLAALRIGSDFRPYGFALLGGALGTLGAIRIDSTTGWIVLAAGATLALGSHFAASALVPGWLLLAGVDARSTLALAPGLVLFVACLWAQREAVRRGAESWWIPAPSPVRLLRQLAVLGGGGWLGLAATLGVIALAGVGCADELGARLALGAALGFVALLGVSWAARPVAWPRTLLLLQPFALAAAGVGSALLARDAGALAALPALAPCVLAAARRIRSEAWTQGDEPWSEALAGAPSQEPATAIAACPPWAALCVQRILPREPVLRLPQALDLGAATALAARLPPARRLLLVVRVDALLLGHEAGIDAFLTGLAESHFERLSLTLVESPDREILTELSALATSIRSLASRSWGTAVRTRSGSGFEVLDYERGDGPA